MRPPRLQHRAHRRALSLCAALSLGCAGEAASAPRPSGPEPPREPMTARLELDVRASETGVALELRNASERPLRLPQGYARLDVREDGEPVRACEAARRVWRPLSTRGVALAPGEAHRADLPLDCLLEQEGERTVLVDVVLGDEVDPRAPAPLAEHLAARGTIPAERGAAEEARAS